MTGPIPDEAGVAIVNGGPTGASVCAQRDQPRHQHSYIPWAECLAVLARRGWRGTLSSEYEGD